MTPNHTIPHSCFYSGHFSWCPPSPPTAWCPHDKSGSCHPAFGPAASPSLVLSGVCSRDQWCWRISQVICTDLENQRGSSFCPWLEAVTQLCWAWLKHSATWDTGWPPQSQDAVRRAICVLKFYIKTQIMPADPPFFLFFGDIAKMPGSCFRKIKNSLKMIFQKVVFSKWHK